MQVSASQFKTLPQVGDMYEGNVIKAVSFGKNGLFLTFESDSDIIYSELCKNAEGCSNVALDGSGTWRSVYLPNVKLGNILPRQFAGILSSLEQKGLYESQDGKFFGRVKVVDTL